MRKLAGVSRTLHSRQQARGDASGNRARSDPVRAAAARAAADANRHRPCRAGSSQTPGARSIDCDEPRGGIARRLGNMAAEAEPGRPWRRA